MIQAKTHEVPIETYFGRWLWCHDPEKGWEGYVHMDCDMITDSKGHCIGCGNPSPAAIELQAPDTNARSSNVKRIAGEEH